MSPERHRGKNCNNKETQYAAQVASLFMTQEEIRILVNKQEEFIHVYNTIFMEEADEGRDTNTLDAMINFEKKATEILFQRYPDYKKAFNKYAGLFNSVIDNTQK